jgi:hypothetical protein
MSQKLALSPVAKWPSPSDSAIPKHRINNPGAPASRYSDPSWSLARMAPPGTVVRNLGWTEWPTGFLAIGKSTAYTLIDQGHPDDVIEGVSQRRTFPSPGTIRLKMQILRKIVSWWTGPWSQAHPDTPVLCPADLDAGHVDDARRWILNSEMSPRTTGQFLQCLVQAWELNPNLPSSDQWPEPTWRGENYLPRVPLEENKTISIHPETFAPLMEWSTAFIGQFATDILAGARDYRERVRDLPENFRAAGAILDQYADSNRPLPLAPKWAPQRVNTLNISWETMAYRHGISARSFSDQYKGTRRDRLEHSSATSDIAMDTPIRAQFHGTPWIDQLTVHDYYWGVAGMKGYDGPGPMLRHLRTAALITTAALSGMRPAEVLSLRRSSIMPPQTMPNGITQLHLVRGHIGKGARYLEDGSPAAPKEAVWSVVPIVHQALEVARQISEFLGEPEDSLLFSNTDRPVLDTTPTEWISSFIQLVNDRLAPQTRTPEALVIPEDPSGLITLRRFRRTLAWHIRNQPNGNVTLAIQYQHVSVTTGRGYAGTNRSGMPSEHARADWEHRKEMHQQLLREFDAGSTFFGPAADRLTDIIQKVPRVLTPQDERRLKKSGELPIYDNPAALALCVFDERQALCKKIEATGAKPKPDLLGCLPTCKNIARTATHVQQVEQEISRLELQAQLSPKPMAQSLLDRASTLSDQLTPPQRRPAPTTESHK